MRDLRPLFRPRSIAVLGGAWAANVARECAKMGFEGAVWPVHPEKSDIGGFPAYRRLQDLPGVPDCAFLGINRDATVEVVTELARLGAGGAICFASGWSETGNRAQQAALIAAAGEMPILGPNCYGLLNYLDGAAIWPDQHGSIRVDRGVAILSQSSNIAINLTMQRRALPIAYVACLGNAAQCGVATVAAALAEDPRVTAVGLYLEGIDDPGALTRLAQELRSAGKGIVAIKSGKTDAGARAAASHTAALVGEASVSSAYLAQSGIAEVATLPEFLETLKILHHRGPLHGRQIAAACCSGGEAGLLADLAARTRLEFPDLEPAREARLSQALGPKVPLANPLDYHTYIWGDHDTTAEVFSAMGEGRDAGLYVIDPPRSDRCDPSSFEAALRAIGTAARQTGAPIFAVSSMPEGLDEGVAQAFSDDGVAALGGLETALAAVDAAATPPGQAGWAPWPNTETRTTRILDESTAKLRLAKAGIAVPKGVTAATLGDLVTASRELCAPLALKGLGFAHKTEAGAVRLNLGDLEHAEPMPGASGYLAEEMVSGGLAELILGVRRDPVYGASLTLGLGGVAAELLADVATLVLPTSIEEITGAFRELRLWPLLDGHRGRPRPALQGAIEVALVLQ
ncbi:MAG: acetate--CoA ligase family protein, partial [Pseudomonadota bacterium]